ncbi:hypothetical protein [Yersinia enterocolitica]|uniref:hypothetical protein n=1 Tax=Yersinia enterocolitica TaxID=630 RepID=UPI003D7BC40A
MPTFSRKNVASRANLGEIHTEVFMVSIKVIIFILGLMVFGAGMSFGVGDQGMGMMRGLALGGLAFSIVIAWSEVKSLVLNFVK